MDRPVIDENHGIERVVRTNTSYGVAYTSGEEEVLFLPWYTRKLACSRHGYETNYYTRVGGWERVECKTWEQAYNHIARSRRLPTSKHIVQEAKQAGVELPESQAKYGLLVSNVGWVRKDCTDYTEVKRLFDEYAGSKQYEQVTLWSSEEHDPIEESYTNQVQDDDFDPWYHPRWDDLPELTHEG